MNRLMRNCLFTSILKTPTRLLSKKQKKLSIEELASGIQAKISSASRSSIITTPVFAIYALPYAVLGICVWFSVRYLLRPGYDPHLGRYVFYRLTSKVR